MMSDWNEQIPKCFRRSDLKFASNAAQLACAYALRAELAEQSISPLLLESAIEEWLHTETSNTGHLYEQMACVRSFFGEPDSLQSGAGPRGGRRTP